MNRIDGPMEINDCISANVSQIEGIHLVFVSHIESTQLFNLIVNVSCIDDYQCWYINHQNHKHTYSYAPHDKNDEYDRFNALYDSDD